MHSVKKLFFVPVGLPGMGKSTLAKNIRLSIEKNLSVESKSSAASSHKLQLTASNQSSPSLQDGSPHTPIE